jgi:hypothetical protein
VTGLLRQGEHEYLKAVVHGAATALCAAMSLYNGAAFAYRVFAGGGTAVELAVRNRHLAANWLLYAVATGWEARQTGRHLARTPTFNGPAVDRDEPVIIEKTTTRWES